MKKIIVYNIFFLCITNIVYSNKIPNKDVNVKENNTDYVQKYKLEAAIDKELEMFFSAIRKHQNKYVTSHLKTAKNLEDRENWKNQNLKEGVYGPANTPSLVIESIAGLGSSTLIDVNSRDRYGYTPIIVAIESKNNEILKVLLDNGANIMEEHPVFGRLTLHTAAYYENEEAVEILLERVPELVNYKSGRDGWTPLQDATLKANVSIVKKLLEKGADPSIKDNTGGSAVDMATEFGKGQIVKLLRDKIKKNRQ